MIDVIFLLLTVLLLIYFCIIKKNDHFSKRGIKVIKSLNFLGETMELTSSRANQKNLQEQFENERFVGMFINKEPFLMFFDPELIQTVLTNDFQHFFDRGMPYDEQLEPLTAHLINLKGQRWKLLRKKLMPVFSSVKLQKMYPQIRECVDELLCSLKNTENLNKLDIEETTAQLSTDVIGSCAFGLQMNSLKNPKSEFRKVGRELFLPTFRARLRGLLKALHYRLPYILRIKFLNKNQEDFFNKVIKETVDYREREKIERNDFLQLLINLRKENIETKMMSHGNNKKTYTEEKRGHEEIVFDDKMIAANSVMFFVAAFQTTSLTLTYCLLELAANEDIQTKLRNEVITACNKYGNEITHELLKEMTYMDLVISETLRKYPPVGKLSRKCTVPYNIPGTSIKVMKGERVSVPVYMLHHNPKYYPNPDKFDPERFNEENKGKRPRGTYLPFGDGPRICIGIKFAMAEIKITLIKLLLEYRIHLNSKTKIPLKWNLWPTIHNSKLLLPQQKIWLDLIPIRQTSFK